MELYFGSVSSENKIILDESESNHLINVKRSQKGDTVYVTDGMGHLFSTIIIEVEKRCCILSVQKKETNKKNIFHLHLAISPTKSLDRMEWFVEKATELGIDEISFLQCRHSERKEIKVDRLNKVAIAAMKQSIKTFIPKINAMVDFNSFVSERFESTKIICTMNAVEILKNSYQKGQSLVALIGPEGDFNPDEIELAVNHGYKKVSLGLSRLRTETAALSVCTLYNYINS